ncbi:hypothetical protein NA56DRAFT_642453 [Hyaloscypha hepaticicola]|uniref:Mid2 domain-containing protein n=1 Tax=Hyaloscypha hepaticicola TaxID=2082293 RepID=A0A2J6QGP6_9HELO|nr:hypothetical protein NA56DRAFT_642453 [Hyaloscypha hepaticicola]
MTCYTFNAFVGVTNSTWGIPCGPGPGIQTCCNSGDFCLSNDTCYTPTTKYGQGVMNLSQPYPYNWYVAGCTDPTYTAPQCSNLCYGYLGLIKPCSGDNWSCGCSLGVTCTCDNSGGTNFTMVPPSQLSTLASISGKTAITWTSSTTSSSTYSSIITSSTTSSTAVTSTSSPPPAPSSNNDTKIGAGVGVPLGIIVLVASGLAFFFWRRSHKKSDGAHADSDGGVYSKPELPATTERRSMAPVELATH